MTVVSVTLATPAAADWDRFRADAQQTGVATGSLAATLEPVWTHRMAEGVETTAAIVDGRVFVGDLAGNFSSLSLATGEPAWTVALEEEIKSSPLVHGDTVYFGDELGRVHGLAIADGTTRFVFEAGGPVTGAPNLGGNCLLFGSYDNHVYCIDPTSGKERWKVETQGYVHGSPAVAGDVALISGCDGFVRWIALDDGTERARLDIGSYVAASPVIVAGHAIFGTFDNQVVAVDLETRAEAWRYTSDRAFPFYSSPASDGETLFLGGRDKRLHALDVASGEARWIERFRARVDASPALVGEHVAAADESGILRLVSTGDGSTVWEFEGADGFAASPAVADGRLVIGAVDGTVYAFAPAP